MNKKLILFTCGIAALAFGGVASYLFFTSSREVDAPEFVFSAEAAPGWWAGRNYNARAGVDDSYQGDTPIDKLDTAFISVHHGENEMSPADDNCFLMYSYFDYPLHDTTQAYTDYEQAKKGGQGDDIALTTTTTSRAQLSTPEGAIDYDLRQYSLDGASLGDMQHGYAIGFATMKSGYVRIEGVCKDSTSLKGIVTTLPAITLRAPRA